jgi:hypothetical protein
MAVYHKPEAQQVEQGFDQQQSGKALEPRTEPMPVKIKWGLAGLSAAALCAGFAWTPASAQPAAPVSLTAQHPKDTKKKTEEAEPALGSSRC